MSDTPPRETAVRLTKTAQRAGCAAKHPPGYLLPLLAGLPAVTDPRVLVASNTADDAAVIRFHEDRALVFTTDFFTPIVDDPFEFGQVAAANALSDVYAMGGRPVSALGIVGFPDHDLPVEVLAEILRGGALKAKEAGIDGSQVGVFYRDGRIDEIAEYCLRDARATAELFRRIEPTLIELFSGK